MEAQLSIPGLGKSATRSAAYEYFLLISPPDHIKDKVRQLRQRLQREITLNEHNLRSIPHISLLKLLPREGKQDLTPHIEDPLRHFKRFMIQTSRLEIFDHRRKKSMVLTFAEPEPIVHLQKLLLNRLGQAEPARMTPHLTIARGIASADYSKVTEPGSYFFSDGFECDRVTILRKPAGAAAGYKITGEAMLR